MSLLLVRHAHAGDRETWGAPDHLRPLSAKGLRQAEGLVSALAGFPVERVMSSPYLRCTQTVEALTLVRGAALERCDALAEGNGAVALDLVQRLAGRPVVLCTHGDVIGEILEAMPGTGHHRMKKGSVWVLESEEGRYVEAHYLPPPA